MTPPKIDALLPSLVPNFLPIKTAPTQIIKVIIAIKSTQIKASNKE